eukprot:TRINITY_DN2014_c0_g1_i1.p1 TRINITY_DN2014_c0_g1~~TRINITY_DN2014_c0_g1_i1.p1  ORF type:complete len:231 (+),score=103.93 TRINITY_DN2014_c0_g1_i1:56-748(+)
MDAEQLEEIEGLVGIYGDEVTVVSSDVPRKLEVKVAGAVLYLTLPAGYPEEAPLRVALGVGGAAGKKITAELEATAEMNIGGGCCMVAIDQCRELLETAEAEKLQGDAEDDEGEEEGAAPESNHGGWIVSTNDPGSPPWVKIAVEVKPGRPRTEIMNPTDIRRSKAPSLDVDVAAPARLGAANTELFKFLSRKLKIARDDIEFASSRKTRSKCLTLKGITVEEVVARMQA